MTHSYRQFITTRLIVTLGKDLDHLGLDFGTSLIERQGEHKLHFKV
jgi:hypothetical protein